MTDATEHADAAEHPASPERGRRQGWIGGVGILISIVAIAGVVIWGVNQPAPDLPSGSSELIALALAVVGVGASTGLRAERWRRLALDAGGSVGHRESYGITVIGFMGNTVLPARGGDALRVLLAGPRAQLPARQAIGTLVAERLLDVVTLVAGFLVLGYVVLRGVDTPEGATIAVPLLAGAAAALVGVWVWRSRNRHEWAGRVVGFLAPMGAPTRNLLSRHGARMLVFTLGVWLAEGAVWLAVSYSTGLDLDPIEALYLVALAAIFILIPAGPGYAGTLDAGVLFGVRALGAGGGAALSYLLALRFVLLVPLTLGGLLLVVFRYGGTRLLRAGGQRA